MLANLQKLFIAILLGAVASQSLGETIFGIKSRAPVGPGASEPPANLFRFEDDGTGFVDLGNVTLSGSGIDVDGLAITETGTLLAFEITAGGSSLISLDPVTAEASSIGGLLAGRDLRGATMDDDGRLLAIDAISDELVEIDPGTGAVIGAATPLTVGGGGFDVNNTSDIAQRGDGVYFLVQLPEIYTVNVNTGAVTLAFTDAGNALAGAAFARDAPLDALFGYEVNAGEDIFQYATASGFSRSTVLTNIIPGFNAGRGDLAAIVPEPVSLLILAGGACGLMGVRPRRRPSIV